MDTDNTPDWVEDLIDAIVAGVEFKGVAEMEALYSEAAENGWGVDLVEIAPEVMDLSKLGAGKGEEGFGIIHSFDLLAAQDAFDEVDSLSFGIENDGRPCITIEGKFREHDVAVLIYSEPFDESPDED